MLVCVYILKEIYFNQKKTKQSNNGIDIEKWIGNHNPIGRHQQYCFVKMYLGEEFSEQELQIAFDKDKEEKGRIIAKLTEIRKANNPDSGQLSIERFYEDLQGLISEGYSCCVLQNDPELECRILGILDKTVKCMQDVAIKNTDSTDREIVEQLGLIVGLTKTEGVLSHIKLGGLLDDDKQAVFLILNSSDSTNKSTDLMKNALALIPPEAAKELSERVLNMAKRLLGQNRINHRHLKEVEMEINQGLLLNKNCYQN
jgi:hypothetical protein